MFVCGMYIWVHVTFVCVGVHTIYRCDMYSTSRHNTCVSGSSLVEGLPVHLSSVGYSNIGASALCTGGTCEQWRAGGFVCVHALETCGGQGRSSVGRWP